MGWLGTAATVGLIGSAIAAWVSPNFDAAQARTDRETVRCLVNSLTQDDRTRMAQFANRNDFNSLMQVYDRIFPDCVVRGDQRERKFQLEAGAWNVLQSDREFAQLRIANAAALSR
jgi:hypothetical protein